jgi:hypothetical protein
MPLQKNILLWFCLLVSSAGFAQPKPHAKISKCTLKDSLLQWSTVEDSVKVIYYVQQFRWNRWISWDSINGINKSDTANYSYNISKYLHSGENQFRIKTNPIPKAVISQTAIKKEKEDKELPLFSSAAIKRLRIQPIEFNKATYYEVLNQYGSVLKKGYGKEVWVNDLPAGCYYLNYDNKTTSFLFSPSKEPH